MKNQRVIAVVVIMILASALIGGIVLTKIINADPYEPDIPIINGNLHGIQIYPQLIVNFNDGTSTTYTPNLPTLTIFDLQSNKPVSDINSELIMVSSFDGEVVSYSVIGSASFSLFQDTSFLTTLGSGSFTVNNDELFSGQHVWLTGGSPITGSALESLLSGYTNPNSNYYFKVEVTSLQVEMEFSDGTTASLSIQVPNLTYDLTWSFLIQ